MAAAGSWSRIARGAAVPAGCRYGIWYGGRRLHSDIVAATGYLIPETEAVPAGSCGARLIPRVCPCRSIYCPPLYRLLLFRPLIAVI